MDDFERKNFGFKGKILFLNILYYTIFKTIVAPSLVSSRSGKRSCGEAEKLNK